MKFIVNNDSLEVNFNENNSLKIPKYIYKFILNKHLLIIPNQATWMVLNDAEFNLFKSLKNKNLATAFDGFKQETINSLLLKIFESDFLSNQNAKDEILIQDIVKNIHINITNTCNMRCKHCFVNAGRVKKENIDIKKIIKKIDEISKYYKSNLKITISGGEPILHKDIFKLIDALKKHEISLFTNGILINENNILFLKERIKDIQVSMEGISKNAYEQNRGIGNYDKFLNSLKLIKKYEIPLHLAVTVLPNTLFDVEKNLFNFVKKFDYHKLNIRLNNDIEMSGAALKELDFSNHDKNKSDEILNKLIIKLAKNNYITIKTTEKNTRFTNCGIGTSIVINPDGKIYPCSKFANYYENFDIPIEKLLKKFDEINEKTSIYNLAKCKNCELKFICSGGCRIDNLLINKDMKKTICDEKYKLKKLEELVKRELLYEATSFC